MIHRNLLQPCNDLLVETRPCNTCRRAKRKLSTAQLHVASPLPLNVESSSDEESDGMLTFTAVEPETSPSNRVCLTAKNALVRK